MSKTRMERSEIDTTDPSAADPGLSIRVVSRLTGLSADTLRMWERRYGFPRPKRSANGVRAYCGAELEHLALIAQAMKLGHRPGDAIRRSREQLQDIVNSSTERTGHVAPTVTPSIEQLTSDLAQGNTGQIRWQLSQAAALLGPKRFVTDYAAPLLCRVGEGWANGTLQIHHEHYVVELLTTQLRQLRAAYDPTAGGPRILLATLPLELHGLGLEMLALNLALTGSQPHSLGVNVPVDQIAEAALALDARVVAISIGSTDNSDTVVAQLRELRSILAPTVPLWIGGRGANEVNVELFDGIERIDTWAKLDVALAHLIHRPSAQRR